MEGSFYDFMFGANKKPDYAGKVTMDAAPKAEAKEPVAESVAMDEGIGEWTHKFVVYCKNPSKEFEEELKSKDGVVAVFAKEKDTKPATKSESPLIEK